MATEELQPRDDLVDTAVKFLQNPQVRQSSLVKKQSFLKKKGLTDVEIRLACDKAGAFVEEQTNATQRMQKNQQTVVPMPSYAVTLPVPSKWTRFRDFLQSVLVVSGSVYGLYVVYKRYIEPYLFGKPKSRKSVDKSTHTLDKLLESRTKELRDNLLIIQNTLVSQQKDIAKLLERENEHEFNNTNKCIKDLKAEVASLKGLLLNRRQFPSTPNPTPSIPMWQLAQELNEDKISKELLEDHPSTTSATVEEAKSEDAEILDPIGSKESLPATSEGQENAIVELPATSEGQENGIVESGSDNSLVMVNGR